MNNTFLAIIEAYQKRFDFTQPLGVLTRANLVFKFGRYFHSDDLKRSLKDSQTLSDMVRVISINTDELSRSRSEEQIREFEIQIVKIITFAKLPKL